MKLLGNSLLFATMMSSVLKLSQSLSFGLRRANFARKSARLSSCAPFYITTPIYYVNGNPHLGHAYTSVMTDIIARFQRKNNKEVYFLTGTDEHGQKVEQSAKSACKPTLEFCSDVSNKFKHLICRLNCSNDEFIRTTDFKHKESAKALWKRLEANGHIYLGAYEGWYSVRDECFYPESDLINGKAPTGADVEWVKEDSYFFRLSGFTQRLLDYYETHPDFIAPRGRRNEVVSFVSQEGGLRDLSISRTTFMWGIPVPGNDNHVMYVWLDALANYISALDYPAVEADKFNKFWPAALHVVGKDILRFHTVYWPAFLMAADLPPPKRIFAHGWWTREGQKMSKSVGNVVDPLELLDAYGPDYVRYFLAAEIRFGSDGDFSHELLCLRVNCDLANNIGNLAQRVTTMIERHCEGKIPTPVLKEEDRALLDLSRSLVPRLCDLVEVQDLKAVCDAVVDLGSRGNKYFDTEAPWKLAKSDQERLRTVLYVLSETLRCIAVCLEPVMPATCTRMLDQLGVPAELRAFESLCSDAMPSGLVIQKPVPLFPRVEVPKIARPPVEKKVKSKLKALDSGGGEEMEALRLAWSRQYDSLNDLQIQCKIEEVGNRIRLLKSSTTDGSNKAALLPMINELNYLKSRVNGKQMAGGMKAAN